MVLDALYDELEAGGGQDEDEDAGEEGRLLRLLVGRRLLRRRRLRRLALARILRERV